MRTEERGMLAAADGNYALCIMNYALKNFYYEYN